MKQSFTPPLCINFIWHPSDDISVAPILNDVRTLLARNPKQPFSRGLNIPLFYYSSSNPNTPPSNFPPELAEKNLVFCFLSENTSGYDMWHEYINNLSLEISDKRFHVISIALDETAFNQSLEKDLTNTNYLRFFNWKDDQVKTCILHMAHEIHRYLQDGFSKDKKGIETSIKLFLSHAKPDTMAIEQAQSISDFIHRTNLNCFFDANTISPGFPFDEEICKHIKDSTFIAIKSDNYSSRHWCQKEILYAKECKRPIIAVDSRTDYEDRILPAASNIPCLHIEHNSTLSKNDILRVLITALLETVRINYMEQLLTFYKKEKWINQDCEILTRPPEIRQILEFIDKGIDQVCYPEPPLYSEEADWLVHMKISAFTPLCANNDNNSLVSKRIGISISEVDAHDFSKFHLHENHLHRLSQDIARHVLVRAGTVIYGGDLRPNGFTEFILNEAVALKVRLPSNTIHVENHLAWPLHITTPEVVAWRGKYRKIMNTKCYLPPTDITHCVDKDKFLSPNTTLNKYIWSRCLTTMRKDSISISDARICAAGKLSGYKGKMPGVIEEIILAIESKKPLYLLGGFGGAVAEVCKVISSNEENYITEALTEQWQLNNNSGYSDLQKYAQENNHDADYNQIKEILNNTTIVDLANNTGLSESEYYRLMNSSFIDECVHLVFKGLKNIFG